MKKIIFIVFIAISFVACADFESWNIDTKNPSSVPAETLFSNAEKSLAVRMQSTSVNYNVFRLLAQHWTETTYVDESNYDLRGRDIGGNFWTNMYDLLNDLNAAKAIIETDEVLPAQTKANELAIISVLKGYVFHVLVDTYGHVPYSEALDINNLTPAYDKDVDIYNDIFSKLDLAIATLSSGGSSFGSADLFYGGDVSLWKKFANSLKLRMAMRIADVNPTLAATKASEAVSSGVFTSNADNFTFNFLPAPPNTNPVWVSLVQSGRSDFVVANTIVDNMNTLSDPRRQFYFDDNIVPYTGGVYGDNNDFDSYTHIGEMLHQPDFPGELFSYSEVEFLLAEAAERSFVGTPASAENHYNKGIEASILSWGGTAADVTTYLAQPSVAYATAATTWQEKIGVQKWLALYNRGFEAWTTYRLFGYPAMNIPPVSLEPVPRRYVYPNDEPDTNGANYDAASQLLGGDLKSSKVFWDN
jgi:hypothetical protein